MGWPTDYESDRRKNGGPTKSECFDCRWWSLTITKHTREGWGRCDVPRQLYETNGILWTRPQFSCAQFELGTK